MARHGSLAAAPFPSVAGTAAPAASPGADRPDTVGRRRPDTCRSLEQPMLPPLCRPSGWVALWRRMGNLSVLNRSSSLLA